MIYLIFLGFLLTHWVGDFVLQSNYVATNKHRSNWILLQHVAIYSVMWFVILWLFTGGWAQPVFEFTLITFISHYVIDWFTSRFNHKLSVVGRRDDNYHNLFVSIGFDQLLHIFQLGVTFNVLFNS